MPPVQRQRGERLEIYPVKTRVDRRGNTSEVPDIDAKLEVTAWVVPDRSSRAEVPGQQQINVYRIGTKADIGAVTLWSRIFWNGVWWDVVTPPAHHTGSRHTRHWTITIRQRPDTDGGLDG